MMDGGMMDGGNMDGGWWIAMWVSMALFWVLVIGVVLAVIRWVGGQRHESADTLLDRRFAAGEMDETEYRAVRDALHGRRPPGTVPGH